MATAHTRQFTPPRKFSSSWQKKQIQLLPHLPYSPDLAPADFFLFPALMRELVGLILSLDKFKTKWEGVIRTLTKDDFTMAFQRWRSLTLFSLFYLFHSVSLRFLRSFELTRFASRRHRIDSLG
jgi:hypothetical protein